MDEKKPILYLNQNSTYIKPIDIDHYMDGNELEFIDNHNKFKFNISDIYYKEVAKVRDDVKNIEQYIRSYFNCDENYTIIFNSGSSESISNVMFWIHHYYPGGIVIGSELDHPTVEAAANNYDLMYEQFNLSENLLDMQHKNIGAIFVTHVSAQTGEIYDLNKLKLFQDKVKINNMNDMDDFNRFTLLFRPLYILDASQSITKLPIDLSKYYFDAVFFSLHKIGGDPYSGILIIKNDLYKENLSFKPLIAGTQNHGLRGGTMNVNNILTVPNLLHQNVINIDKMKKVWDEFTSILDEYNITYYKPKFKHLHSTILVENMNNNMIKILYKYGYAVGAYTACVLETSDINDNALNYIRISWNDETNIKKDDMINISKIILENKK